MASAAENKRAKRLKILDAANRLFIDGSFADTAIDDVVQLAGVAKGTFYLYFRDKYDLLDQIIVRRAAEIVSEGCRKLREQAAQRPMTAAQQLIYLADVLIDYLRLHKKEAALLDKRFSICFAVDAEQNGELFEAVRYVTGLLVTPCCPPQQAMQKLYLLGNMVLYSACDALLGEKPFTIEQIRPVLHTMIENSVGGDKT